MSAGYFLLPDVLNLGGPKQRYDQNVAAIRLLHELRQPGRVVTDDDRSVLCLYSGWGDSAVLKYARKVNNFYGRESVTNDPNDDLKSLATTEEWERLLGSTFNAHYTSLDVVRAIWQGVEALGYATRAEADGLRFLDPSAGVGHFWGAAPEWLRACSQKHKPVMVELDSLTAEIAGHLYPEAEVVCSGFEQTYREKRGTRSHSPLGIFDLVVSNVPFGKVKVADPGMKPKAATESLHNYFITRMLELTRPGGLVVAVTSRYSLDGTTSGPVCRQTWAERAKLEMSVRLPCDAFRANAGTEVVTDVLFLRRLYEGEQGNGLDWVGVSKRPVLGEKKEWRYVSPDGSLLSSGAWDSRAREISVPYTVDIPVSGWYTTHPDCILGTEALTATMYANRSSYGALSADASAADLKAVEQGGKRGNNRKAWEEQRHRELLGKYNIESDPNRPTLEAFRSCVEKYLSPVVSPATADVAAGGEFCALPSERQYEPSTDLQARWWRVYKAAKRVIDLQVNRCSDEDLSAAQASLSSEYDSARSVSGRVSSPAVTKAFADRPDIHSFLLALEQPDGGKEAIFTRRTIYPEAPTVSSTDPVDAVYRCLNTLGKLDIGWVGRACGISKIQVIEALGDLIYKDPETESWVLADEYLSGNVRRKLRLARATLHTDGYYARNIAALERVQPADLEPQDVSVSLKATWVPESILSAFLCHLVGANRPAGFKMAHIVSGSWVLDWDHSVDSWTEARALSTSRASLGWLLQCGLDGRTPRIYDEEGTPDGKTRRVLNSEQTVLAQAKLDEIQRRYVEFLWSDVGRSAELLEVYNDKFNCFVPRKWDGSFLTFPGMNTEITLREFQKNGVARVLFADRKNHPALIWPTGAGKTFGGIASVEKLLQLGLARKVLICVPKHLVPQWVDDYRRLFPGRSDQILCAGKDSLTKKERGVFLSRAATGGYRVVILSHSQLKAIPVKDETFDLVVREQLEQLESEIADQESLDDSRTNVTLKRLQQMKKTLEARLTDRAQRTAKDSSWTVTFEELGFDVFVGDEAQAWKNLQLVTRMGNVAGIRTGNSQISLDFLVKVRHLQRHNGRVILATATPVANSLAETFVFASYLQHEELMEQGIETPDAFFGAFTKTYSSVELEPSCAAYRVVSRLEFGNIPELVRMLRQSWHVVRPEDLGLKLPQLATGQEIVVQTPGSDGLQGYVENIADRVKLIRNGDVEPSVDNMLKVCSDGRWASLVNGPPDGEIRDTKLDRVAENVLRHYRETEKERGAQLVFCDLGTPTGEKATTPEPDSSDQDADEALTAAGAVEQARVYEYVRSLLLVGGIPRNEVEFLQDHQGDPKALRELYRRVNAGEVRVLLGSAPTGMNVQERLCALHHIDPVWRPDWKTQRDGRILRQGNTFGVVSIYLYLTEGSFDAYMWGLVKSKLRVIEQVTCGDPTIRRIDGDVGEIVLRASEIQAIASGNPAVLTFVGVQNELTKLSALRNEHERNRTRMEWRKRTIPQLKAAAQDRIARHKEAWSTWLQRPQGRGSFLAKILGEEYDDKKEAGNALLSCTALASKEESSVVVGDYCGFILSVRVFGSRADVLLHLPGSRVGSSYDVAMSSATGVWTAIDNRMADIPRQVSVIEAEVDDMDRDLVAIERALPEPWSRSSDYAREYARYETLAKQLAGTGVSMGEFTPPEAGWVEEERPAAGEVKGVRWVQTSFEFFTT